MSKILVSLPDEMLKRMDVKAKKNHMTRSEAVREAVRQWFSGVVYVPPSQRPDFGEWNSSVQEARAAGWEKGKTAEKMIREDRELIDKIRQRAADERKPVDTLVDEWMTGKFDGNRRVQEYRRLMKRLAHVRPGRTFSREEMNER